MTKSISTVYFLTFFILSGCVRTMSNQSDISLANHSFIGTKQFIWEDTTRVDNYYGSIRKVNAQVWYPSIVNDSLGIQSPYFLFYDKVVNKLDGWSDDDYESVENIKTNSILNASIKKPISKFPLVIFSPSLGGNLSYYTYYSEYLARHDYVVMGVNHLYESEVVISKENNVFTSKLRFHDSLKTLNIPDQITAERYREVKGKRQEILGLDLVFSMNQIFNEPYFKNILDEDKIGAFGHSIGGAAVIYLSILDERIKAVIDLDGTPPTIALNEGIDVPFLFIEDLTDYRNHQGYAKLHKRRNDFCELNRDDAWRVLIGGFNHNSFLDTNYYLSDDENEIQQEEKNLNLVLDYMNKFFNSYLMDLEKMDLVSSHTDTLEVHKFSKE